MEAHALELLNLALWVIGGAGGLIAFLLLLILGIARWSGLAVLSRMDSQDETMVEIKDLLSSETKLLREALHTHDVRIVRLEEFKARVQSHLRFGRRTEDQDPGDD